MIKRILNRLFPKIEKPIYREPDIYDRGYGWGNSIDFIEFNQKTRIGRVYGWKTPRPKVNDLLYSPMNSGKIGVFEFIEVEYCHDPDDMFFA